MTAPDHIHTPGEGQATGLDAQLCFALYATTNAITRAWRPLLAPLGLTYPQYLVLLVLWDARSATVGQLAARLGLAPGALSPLLDRLEAAGRVVRRRDAADRRVVHVEATAEGRALESRVAPLQQALACRTGLDPAEVAALRDSLAALARRLGADAPAPTAPDRGP